MGSPLHAGKQPTPRRTSPAFLLALWFFIVLTAGTLLLYLPWTHQPEGPEITFLTALFTAVSAFCVTGLVIVDTPAAFNTFGEVVILLLIELGGVGIMSFAALGVSMFGRRLSLAGEAVLTDTLLQNNPFLELRTIFRNIFKSVVLIQFAGFVILYLAIVLKTPHDAVLPNPAWAALFHSISAFCNAGFSVYHGNLEAVNDNWLFLAGIMIMVILGGLGFAVLAELYHFPHLFFSKRTRPHRLSGNSRLVIIATVLLLAVGGGGTMLLNALYGNGDQNAYQAFFHSVIARTAGFNATTLETLSLPVCVLLCILMFVGGSPGSCAGGIRTTSAAIWLATIASGIRQSTDVTVLRYSVRPGLVSKIHIIIALSFLWIVLGVTVLAISEPAVRLDLLVFEQISALATVGLSMGLTPRLNAFSQVWIIISMILGKFGPLTVAMWMVTPQPRKIRHPEASFLV